jgi:hypothetical protein
MSKDNSKLDRDEEAATCKDEPMGSVAAAIPRDEGSSAGKLKQSTLPDPKKSPKPTPPSK